MKRILRNVEMIKRKTLIAEKVRERARTIGRNFLPQENKLNGKVAADESNYPFDESKTTRKNSRSTHDWEKSLRKVNSRTPWKDKRKDGAKKSPKMFATRTPNDSNSFCETNLLTTVRPFSLPPPKKKTDFPLIEISV